MEGQLEHVEEIICDCIKCYIPTVEILGERTIGRITWIKYRMCMQIDKHEQISVFTTCWLECMDQLSWGDTSMEHFTITEQKATS